jgi:hypothetical protein
MTSAATMSTVLPAMVSDTSMRLQSLRSHESKRATSLSTLPRGSALRSASLFDGDSYIDCHRPPGGFAQISGRFGNCRSQMNLPTWSATAIGRALERVNRPRQRQSRRRCLRTLHAFRASAKWLSRSASAEFVLGADPLVRCLVDRHGASISNSRCALSAAT